jgi:membrane protein DedA with SNARE-associated domain/rhodanese-related sulfurtransferase
MMNVQLQPLMEHYGLLLVFLAVLVDQLGLPLPAIPVLIVAGTAVTHGGLSAPALFGLSIAACLIADLAWFIVGRLYGVRVLKTLCRISLEPDSCVNQTQTRFERWGVNSLLFAKFIPGLAIIAPPLAGAIRVNPWRFVLLSTAGAALWSAAGLGTGMIFQDQIAALLRNLSDTGALAALGLSSALVAYILYKWWRRRRFYAELRMARINVNDLNQLMAAGQAPLIVDVRSHTARSLEPRWIPTAIHAPVEEMAHRIRDLPRERDVVLYCTCPNEASAARVAKQLMNHGFTRVRPLLGGLDAWIAAGYAVDRSSNNPSTESSA